MRIVTRVDFDSIVCAVLLYDALEINEPVKWVEPEEIQNGLADIKEGDIVANLPFHEKCSLWFDHHYSNRIETPFNGSFRIAPSAAGVIYGFYKDRFKRDHSELVKEADKIDDARLSVDEVLHPEKYPYVLLSMTLSSQNRSDEPYWSRLIDLLGKHSIDLVMNDPEVQDHCRRTIEQNREYKTLLLKHTTVKDHVAITDFRSLDSIPEGNRFLAYSLFPETVVSVRIGCDKKKGFIKVRVGHSIFNRNCNVNVGLMLSMFEGGGHRGAGAASFHESKADDYIPRIIEILLKNEDNEKD